MKHLLLALFGACSISVSADIIKLNPGSGEIEGVNVATGATVAHDGQEHQLTTVGAGLRRSKVFGPVAIKVYVGQLMVADSTHFEKSAERALQSMDRQSRLIMRLTFLRDVPSEKMVESFTDSLVANGLSPDEAEISRFMNLIRATGDVDKNTSITLFVTRNEDGSETLIYEVSGRPPFNPEVMSAQFLNRMASLWLGQPSDEGLKDFKSDLLR